MHFFQRDEQVEVVLLLSNHAAAGALTRAQKFGVPTQVFSRAEWKEGDVLRHLSKFRVTHLVLAGFLWLVPEPYLKAYPDRIINIHPSLLPSFGGKGMYGMHVHEAVKKAGENITGITIHLVNEHFDKGRILFQASCPVEADDTPAEIAVKVHNLEHAHFPRVIRDWALGRLSV